MPEPTSTDTVDAVLSPYWPLVQDMGELYACYWYMLLTVCVHTGCLMAVVSILRQERAYMLCEFVVVTLHDAVQDGLNGLFYMPITIPVTVVCTVLDILSHLWMWGRLYITAAIMRMRRFVRTSIASLRACAVRAWHRVLACLLHCAVCAWLSLRGAVQTLFRRMLMPVLCWLTYYPRSAWQLLCTIHWNQHVDDIEIWANESLELFSDWHREYCAVRALCFVASAIYLVGVHSIWITFALQYAVANQYLQAHWEMCELAPPSG